VKHAGFPYAEDLRPAADVRPLEPRTRRWRRIAFAVLAVVAIAARELLWWAFCWLLLTCVGLPILGFLVVLEQLGWIR
jgi:hypothetical protein